MLFQIRVVYVVDAANPLHAMRLFHKTQRKGDTKTYFVYSTIQNLEEKAEEKKWNIEDEVYEEPLADWLTPKVYKGKSMHEQELAEGEEQE